MSNRLDEQDVDYLNHLKRQAAVLDDKGEKRGKYYHAAWTSDPKPFCAILKGEVR